MNKKLLAGIIIGISLVVVIVFVVIRKPVEQSAYPKTDAKISSADKVEVVHFHGTRQCWSCSTLGEYAKETVSENFTAEQAEGRIVFLEINSDLPENREMVQKFQARGSALFLNAIANEKDNIKEDVYVWRLVEDEAAFKKYLTEKINNLWK